MEPSKDNPLEVAKFINEAKKEDKAVIIRPYELLRSSGGMYCFLDRKKITKAYELAELGCSASDIRNALGLNSSQYNSYLNQGRLVEAYLLGVGIDVDADPEWESKVPNGFEFELVVSNRYSLDKIAQVVQSQLSKINVKVKIDLVEWGIFISRWGNSDFDAFVSLNSGSIDPDIQFYRTFHSDGSTNVFLYSNPIVDKLLQDGRTETDVSKRMQIYEQLQKILIKESPILFLYSPNIIYAGQNYVEDFTPLANESLIFLRETWLNK